LANERWREPAEIVGIEHLQQAIWLPDGRRQSMDVPVLTARTKERMRTGHMCVKCQEPFEHAWPKLCHVCGCRVRSEQAEYFAREFGGEIHVGPSTSIDEEIARMHEDLEREQKENP